MVEEERFGCALQNVDEVIVAADVGEFVGEDGLELCGGKTGEKRGGNEDERAEKSDDERGGDERGLRETDIAGDAHSFGEVMQYGKKRRRRGSVVEGAEAMKCDPAAEIVEGEKKDSENPERDEGGKNPLKVF